MTGTDWLGGRSLSNNDAFQWRLSKQTPEVQVSSRFLSSKCLSFRNCLFVHPQWGQCKYLLLPLCYFMFADWYLQLLIESMGSYSCYYLLLGMEASHYSEANFGGYTRFAWPAKSRWSSTNRGLSALYAGALLEVDDYLLEFPQVGIFIFWHSTLYLDYSLLILIPTWFQLPYVNHICLMHSNK